ncbi:MAG: secondary thiamine-phosphate synthase enzyme YjbQ [Proteobacteria bacterium]|nr:secondary thiamine-phosphate synthase enzyme YjbQ [Pseudomonadota bacterium]
MLMDITVTSASRTALIDITASIQEKIRLSGIQEGLCFVFVPHTTAAVTINENADPDVKTDILSTLKRVFPQDPSYRHREGNSDAHVKSSLVGASETLIIQDGRLVLGTWQSVFFCEFDGPRTRKVLIRIQ